MLLRERHWQIGVQPSGTIHRSVSPAPRAVRDVSTQEHRQEERFRGVDRRLKLGRSLAVPSEHGIQR